MKKISTCLWFDGNAENAAKFYVSTFKGSKLGKITRWGKEGPGRKGSVLTVSFRLLGHDFVALNGGPQYRFTPAISLVVPCRNQKEIDTLWSRLTRGGGKEQPCGWLVDRFGVSWQIIPANVDKLIAKPAAMRAMLGMKKLDIARLKRAAAENE